MPETVWRECVCSQSVIPCMPSYKTKQIDGNGRNVYKDVCFPITKEFREKLNSVIMQGFEQAKKKQQEAAKEQSDNFVPISDVPDNLPFR